MRPTTWEAALLAAVTRVAEALEAQVQLMTPEVEPSAAASTECLHPEDARRDFGFTDGEADWQCQRCGFRSVVREVAGHG